MLLGSHRHPRRTRQAGMTFLLRKDLTSIPECGRILLSEMTRRGTMTHCWNLSDVGLEKVHTVGTTIWT